MSLQKEALSYMLYSLTQTFGTQFIEFGVSIIVVILSNDRIWNHWDRVYTNIYQITPRYYDCFFALTNFTLKDKIEN